MIPRILLVLTPLALLHAQTDWNKPFPPHKVIGNIYYVGTEALASFLITTPEGHIFVNSDFESTVPQLKSNVEKLGFKFTDVKILLGSHAHGDHMEGDALFQEMSGARVMAMEQDDAGQEAAPHRSRPEGRRRGQARRHDSEGASYAGPHEGLHHLDHAGSGRG